jgi:hypothetical protein
MSPNQSMSGRVPGRTIRTARAPVDGDFNDVMRGQA